MDRRNVNRLPQWLKKEKLNLKELHKVKQTLRQKELHTVCESAMCPNRGECFRKGTATFLLLGNVCTRNCGFCSVTSGKPAPPDPMEPTRIVEAVREMNIRYAVLTMVTRDDLPDGGAALVAETVRRIHQLEKVRIEVLVSDFNGNSAALDTILDSPIDVFNHNVEMVPSRYPAARPQANYAQSLDVLRHAAERDGLPVKSGFMVGLGESEAEVTGLMQDLHATGVSILTIGQYLRPTMHNVPVEKYWTPEEFQSLEQQARSIGFAHVFAGPLVRSSYMADTLFAELNRD